MADQHQSQTPKGGIREKPQRDVAGGGTQTSGSRGQEREHGVKNIGSVGRDVERMAKPILATARMGFAFEAGQGSAANSRSATKPGVRHRTLRYPGRAKPSSRAAGATVQPCTTSEATTRMKMLANNR
jgi:hypothetical protein